MCEVPWIYFLGLNYWWDDVTLWDECRYHFQGFINRLYIKFSHSLKTKDMEVSRWWNFSSGELSLVPLAFPTATEFSQLAQQVIGLIASEEPVCNPQVRTQEDVPCFSIQHLWWTQSTGSVSGLEFHILNDEGLRGSNPAKIALWSQTCRVAASSCGLLPLRSFYAFFLLIFLPTENKFKKIIFLKTHLTL